MKTWIRYFETKEMEKSDNDTMFEKIDDSLNKNDIVRELEPESEEESIKKSYWGLQRVIKKSQTQIPLHKQDF